jgi:hypothetical protein
MKYWILAAAFALLCGQHARAGKMFWTVHTKGNKIQRANLDGSSVQDVLASGLGEPFGLAIVIDDGKLYWTNANGGKLRRANFDGS